jgi:hypothetical protein
MDMNPEDLELVLLPGRHAPPSHREQYHLAYACWRDVWQEAYQKEMDVDKELMSDDFTRQDEVMALFYEKECAAVVFFKWVDFNETPTWQDSYFKSWPEIALQGLCRHGRKILISSQFTLNFKFRKNYLNFPWKDLLVALGIERFIHSDCDAMTGTMRLQKNMGEATYRSGGTPLCRNVDYGMGQTADLVGFFHGEVRDSIVPGIPEIVHVIFPKVTALVKPVIKHQEVSRAA